MDALSDDPDTIQDFNEIAHTLNLPPQTVAGIFFAVFIVVCMGISLGCWYMHHRYTQAQRRATFPAALESGSKSRTGSPQMSMASHWRNPSTTSSTQGLLPKRPERAVLSIRSASDQTGPTNSSVTLVGPTAGPMSPKDAALCRTSKTYSLTLLDFYATMDDYPQCGKDINTSRSVTL
ncbi:hypothetical protein FRC04_002407 [Tulasnella sp. 424]|nr:hypothetical protein FRC04_002407 [Tulasnella sp. 424]KAG8972865.1 hypothetical protein FRC05_009504 [Tulasnella sp. 425]